MMKRLWRMLAFLLLIPSVYSTLQITPLSVPGEAVAYTPYQATLKVSLSGCEGNHTLFWFLSGEGIAWQNNPTPSHLQVPCGGSALIEVNVGLKASTVIQLKVFDQSLPYGDENRVASYTWEVNVQPIPVDFHVLIPRFRYLALSGETVVITYGWSLDCNGGREVPYRIRINGASRCVNPNDNYCTSPCGFHFSESPYIPPQYPSGTSGVYGIPISIEPGPGVTVVNPSDDAGTIKIVYFREPSSPVPADLWIQAEFPEEANGVVKGTLSGGMECSSNGTGVKVDLKIVDEFGKVLWSGEKVLGCGYSDEWGASFDPLTFPQPGNRVFKTVISSDKVNDTDESNNTYTFTVRVGENVPSADIYVRLWADKEALVPGESTRIHQVVGLRNCSGGPYEITVQNDCSLWTVELNCGEEKEWSYTVTGPYTTWLEAYSPHIYDVNVLNNRERLTIRAAPAPEERNVDLWVKLLSLPFPDGKVPLDREINITAVYGAKDCRTPTTARLEMRILKDGSVVLQEERNAVTVPCGSTSHWTVPFTPTEEANYRVEVSITPTERNDINPSNNSHALTFRAVSPVVDLGIHLAEAPEEVNVGKPYRAVLRLTCSTDANELEEVSYGYELTIGDQNNSLVYHDEGVGTLDRCPGEKNIEVVYTFTEPGEYTLIYRVQNTDDLYLYNNYLLWNVIVSGEPVPTDTNAPAVVEFVVSPSEVNVGEPVTLEWNVVDESGVNVTIDLGDGNEVDVNASGSLTYTYQTAGVYTITLHAVDPYGNESNTSATVTVLSPEENTTDTNAPNILYFNVHPTEINAGESVTVEWNVVDESEVNVVLDCGNGVVEGPLPQTGEATCTYEDAGSYTLLFRAMDEYGNTSTRYATVVVNSSSGSSGEGGNTGSVEVGDIAPESAPTESPSHTATIATEKKETGGAVYIGKVEEPEKSVEVYLETQGGVSVPTAMATLQMAENGLLFLVTFLVAFLVFLRVLR